MIQRNKLQMSVFFGWFTFHGVVGANAAKDCNKRFWLSDMKYENMEYITKKIMIVCYEKGA